MIKEIEVSGRVEAAAREYRRSKSDVDAGRVPFIKSQVKGYFDDPAGTTGCLSVITIMVGIGCVHAFLATMWFWGSVIAVFLLLLVGATWMCIDGWRNNPKALEAHQKKLMKHAIKISQSDHHALAAAVENAAITVTMHVREWNRYLERLVLGLVERDANHDEYERVLTRARDTVDLAMRRTEVILRDRSRGKRTRSLQLPDLAEALEELQRADVAVKAHLDAAKEIGDDDPLLLARMQAEMDEALREIPGHQGAREHLGLAKS